MKLNKLGYLVLGTLATTLLGSFGINQPTQSVQAKAKVQATKIVKTKSTNYWVKPKVSNKAYAYTAKLGKKLFKLKTYQKVVFTSQYQRKIKVNGQYHTYRYVKGNQNKLKGWVNSGYLTRAKAAVKTDSPTTTTSNNNPTTTTGSSTTSSSSGTTSTTVKTPVKDPTKSYTPDQGASWSSTNITYAFYPKMSQSERALWYTAISEWNNVNVVNLTETSDYNNANIKITNVASGSTGSDENTVGISYIQRTTSKNPAGFYAMKSATIGILPEQAAKFNFDYTYTQFIAVHEMGHALGLAMLTMSCILMKKIHTPRKSPRQILIRCNTCIINSNHLLGRVIINRQKTANANLALAVFTAPLNHVNRLYRSSIILTNILLIGFITKDPDNNAGK